MNPKNKTLAFKVSSGLKNLIGRDLISDKYIAIFELVKNSYDANASNVKISYLVSEQGIGKIIISDNGTGMTYEDIIQKWLFVAYSEKNHKTDLNRLIEKKLSVKWQEQKVLDVFHVIDWELHYN